MEVYLNGLRYYLRPDTNVVRSALQEWPDNIRLDGQQQRKDRRYISSWAMDDWSEGLGRKEINSNVAADFSSLWDAENIDTRWSSLVLSPKLHTPTVGPYRVDLRMYMDHMGELYFVNETGVDSYAFKYDPTNDIIGSYNVLGTFGGPYEYAIGSLRGLKNVGNKIYAYGVYNMISSGTYYQAVFFISGLGGQTDAQLLTSGNLRIAKMTDVGGTVVALRYPSAGTVRFDYIAAVPSGVPVGLEYNETVGTYMPDILNNGTNAYAILQKGLYEVDATPQVIVNVESSKDMNGRAVIFQNYIYFKNGKSLIKWDGTDLVNVGYNLRDGLPSDKYGEITAMAASSEWLFAAVMGASYSHILAMTPNHKWHYYAKIPTINTQVREMFFSNSPDGIDRLWCMFTNQPAGFFYNPNIDPLLAGTYSHVPTGYVTTPIYDGGLGEDKAGYFRNKLLGNGIGGSFNVAVFYGLNNMTPTQPLGVIASNNALLTFGSPAGVEGNSIQMKYVIAGGSLTQQYYDSAVPTTLGYGLSMLYLSSEWNQYIGVRFEDKFLSPRKLNQFIVNLGRQGSPTGTLSVKILRPSDNSILYTSPTTINPLTLGTGGYVLGATYAFPLNLTVQEDVIIALNYTGGDLNNRVTAYFNDTGTMRDPAQGGVGVIMNVGSTDFATLFGGTWEFTYGMYSQNEIDELTVKKAYVEYLKDPDKRYQYDFDIDLDETARAESSPLENIIGSLNNTLNQKTLVPFFYGQIGTRYVKILDSNAAEIVNQEKIYLEQRGGLLKLRAIEI